MKNKCFESLNQDGADQFSVPSFFAKDRKTLLDFGINTCYTSTVRIRIKRKSDESNQVLEGKMKNNRDYIREFNLILNNIDGQYYIFAKRLGMKENELAILYALDDGGHHTQKEICEQWLIPKTTVNTIVREFVKEGYITLSCEHNSKEKIIALTDKGRNYAAPVLEKIYAAEERAMELTVEKYSDEFISAFECFSDQLSREFAKRLPKEGE